jgi:hypothetical protein
MLLYLNRIRFYNNTITVFQINLSNLQDPSESCLKIREILSCSMDMTVKECPIPIVPSGKIRE